MTFNVLMMRLAAEALQHLPERPSVVEAGNQSFRPRGSILNEVSAYLDRENRRHDKAALDSIRKLKGAALDEQTRNYYLAIGYGMYQCIDINSHYDSLVMDLNLDLGQHYNFTQQFDLVTNNGTSEHIFDQAAVFRNLHNLAKPGGLMLHALPYFNYLNHGFFNYQPNLFYDLAKANGYELLRLGIVALRGREVSYVASAKSSPVSTTRPIGHMPLKDVLDPSAVSLSLGGTVARVTGFKRDPMAAAITAVGKGRFNIAVLAVMRRTSDAAFKLPLQTMYTGENIGSSEIASRYSM